MALILHIESSSTVCSVAISNDDTLICFKEINNGYSHAENLHVFIQYILKSENIKPQELHAISVSSGPGSYTGLRIGYSTAKGLCYALNIPLIEVSTLQALAHCASLNTSNTNHQLFCPLIDARRMEVYTAIYDMSLDSVVKPQALILTEESINLFKQDKTMVFFGDGMQKAKALLQAIHQSVFIDEVIMPSSKSLVALAYKKYVNQQFADTAYAEPDYLKEFYFQTAQK